MWKHGNGYPQKRGQLQDDKEVPEEDVLRIINILC